MLLSNHAGAKLNGPNDVWVAPDGAIFLTDPYYQRPWWPHTDPPPDEFNAELRRQNASLGAGLTDQIRSLAPDKTEPARRAKHEADLAQIQRDLDAIKARLGSGNPPAGQWPSRRENELLSAQFAVILTPDVRHAEQIDSA